MYATHNISSLSGKSRAGAGEGKVSRKTAVYTTANEIFAPDSDAVSRPLRPFRQSARQERARSAGIGLVEVLVALLVFSVGILGVTAMQLAAKRSGYEATQRSIATSLARDIIERMRSNPGQLPGYVVSDLGSTHGQLYLGLQLHPM